MLARRPNLAFAVPDAPAADGEVVPSQKDGSAIVQGFQKPKKASPEAAFAALDAWLLSAERGGLVAVTTRDAETAEAIADHVARRFDGRALRASSGPAEESWREVAERLTAMQVEAGAAAETHPLLSARDVALAIVDALPHAPAFTGVVVNGGVPSRFAAAVANEIHAASTASTSSATASITIPPVVWIVSGSAAEKPALARTITSFDVNGALDREAVRAWWEAARSEALPAGEVRIEDLERWWRVSRAQIGAPRSETTSEAASRAHARLSIVGRAWPLDMLSDLSIDEATVRELVATALVDVREVDGDAVVVVRSPSLQAPQAVEAQVAATALERRFGNDPWALMCASELMLGVGLIEKGDELARAAIAGALDADARIDFWQRFHASMGPSVSATRLLPFVDLALRKGDGDWALKLARDAVAADDRASGAVLLALGRALAASGDLTAASLTLEKVTTSACTNLEERLVAARACVELAEARYFASDLTSARKSAEDAVTRLGAVLEAEPSSVRAAAVIRLDARNVLGKLLLAQADFTAAEHHFATDAFEASLVRQPVSELRARVNRAIAVMSLGRRSEAQNLLEGVLSEAEKAGELKAIGIALINLAALAIADRRYGEGLELSERAVEILRRIGDRVALSRCVANLAELRVKLGLVEEAAQAVRFGVRVLSGGLPPEQAARFALVFARVALGKGDTSSAQRHVTQALAALGATMSLDTNVGDGAVVARGTVAETVSESLRFAARIALEDGDTARARVLIERAERERAPHRARADLSVLRALLARATGEAYDALATDALRAARDADDDELLREAHMLLFRSAADEGATAIARHHLDAALALRDRVAEGVPASLRDAFLRRRDLAEIDRESRTFEQQRASHEIAVPEAFVPASRASSPSFPPYSAFGSPPANSGVVSAPAPTGPRRMVGEDRAVIALLHAIRKVGPADATVLIHGESGTGKELVAEALHEASTRKNGPLVKVNCAALVETLLLSELFGHEKGAFTGAAGRRRGRFEAAEGGTLFLDEIGDISPRTQVALLRVLQEKTFERVGGTTPIRANVRVVCATHRNLKQLVARGEFREDLYYRLCGVTLEVPALRARLGDLGALSEAILRRIADERGGPVKRLSPSALMALKSHPWPGNVRELENGLRAASLFAEGDVLEAHDFADNVESLRHISETVDVLGPLPVRRDSSIPDSAPAVTVRAAVSGTASIGPEGAQVDGMPDGTRSGSSIGAPSTSGAPGSPGSAMGATPSEVAYAQVRSGVSLHDMKRLIERECIVRALGDAGGNITKAATLLGMKRPRLSQLVKQYGLGGGDTSEDDGSVGSDEED